MDDSVSCSPSNSKNRLSAKRRSTRWKKQNKAIALQNTQSKNELNDVTVPSQDTKVSQTDTVDGGSDKESGLAVAELAVVGDDEVKPEKVEEVKPVEVKVDITEENVKVEVDGAIEEENPVDLDKHEYKPFRADTYVEFYRNLVETKIFKEPETVGVVVEDLYEHGRFLNANKSRFGGSEMSQTQYKDDVALHEFEGQKLELFYDDEYGGVCDQSMMPRYSEFDPQDKSISRQQPDVKIETASNKKNELPQSETKHDLMDVEYTLRPPNLEHLTHLKTIPKTIVADFEEFESDDSLNTSKRSPFKLTFKHQKRPICYQKKAQKVSTQSTEVVSSQVEMDGDVDMKSLDSPVRSASVEKDDDLDPIANLNLLTQLTQLQKSFNFNDDDDLEEFKSRGCTCLPSELVENPVMEFMNDFYWTDDEIFKWPESPDISAVSGGLEQSDIKQDGSLREFEVDPFDDDDVPYHLISTQMPSTYQPAETVQSTSFDIEPAIFNSHQSLLPPPPPDQGFVGFGFASGKNCEVKVDQKKKFTNFFDSIFNEDPLASLANRKGNKSAFSKPFQSPVQPPNTSIQTITADAQKENLNLPPPGQGFGLASGKACQLNEAKLNKFSNFFGDILAGDPLANFPAKKGADSGFGTATLATASTGTKPSTSTFSKPKQFKSPLIQNNDFQSPVVADQPSMSLKPDQSPPKMPNIVNVKDTSFDCSFDLPPDFDSDGENDLKHLENVLKAIETPTTRSTKPPTSPLKPLNQLQRRNIAQINNANANFKSPLITTNNNIPSPGIDTPTLMENFGCKATFQSSTPVTRVPQPHSRLINPKRTRLMNRLSNDSNISSLQQMSDQLKEVRKQKFELQGNKIKEKSEDLKKPIPSTLYSMKQQKGRPRVGQVVELRQEPKPTPISNHTTHRFNLLDFYTVESFEQNDCAIKLPDNAELIPAENFTCGTLEVRLAFLAMPGVDSKLIQNKWFENHYRLIFWKLSQYDSRHRGRFLTPENILTQLKYRYDKEIDNAHRSCIRRFIEGDDVVEKRMAFAVLDIRKDGNKILGLELTDGWYAIRTELDTELIRRVTEGRIKVGTKLLTACAELKNLTERAHALEGLKSAVLRIHYNSTRRAKQNQKLGYLKPALPLQVSLNDVRANGGVVGSLLLLVIRVYPETYHDRERKTTYTKYHEQQIRKQIDSNRFNELNSSYQDIVNEVTREFNESRRSKRSRLDFEEDLSYMTDTQQESFKNEQRELNEEISKEISKRVCEKMNPQKRDVVPCRKLRVVDANQPNCDATLTLWQSQNVFHLWKEGSCIRITHTNPQSTDGLRLSTSNSTLIQMIEKHSFTVPERFQRNFTPIKLIDTSEKRFNEIDTHGLVIDVQTLPLAEVAIICDSEGHMVAVNFWGTLKEHGLVNLVTPGTFLRFSNLQWREQGSRANTHGSQFITLFMSLNTELSDMKKRSTSVETDFMESFNRVDVENLRRVCSEKLGKELDKSIFETSEGGRSVNIANKRRSSGESVVSLPNTSSHNNSSSNSSVTERPRTRSFRTLGLKRKKV